MSDQESVDYWENSRTDFQKRKAELTAALGIYEENDFVTKTVVSSNPVSTIETPESYKTNGSGRTWLPEKNVRYINDTATRSVFTTRSRRCRRLRAREVVLLTIAAVSLCGIIALVVLLKLQMNSKPEDICLTDQCTATAARILGSLDHSVNPCDDFYQFACGTWNKKNVIPEELSSYNTLGELYDEVQVTLKDLLETDIQTTDIEAVLKAKHLYQSCLDESLIEERGVDVIFPLLRELNGWPVLENVSGIYWDDESFDLIDLLVTMRKYGNFPIISMRVDTDSESALDRIIYLDQPEFGMPNREYLLKGMDDPIVRAYVKLATDIALGLGAETTTASLQMTEMVEFETLLAYIAVSAEDRSESDILYKKMEARSLSQNFQETLNFDWMQYLRNIMSLPGVNVSIPDTEPIVVCSSSYFSKIFELLNETPKRTIANYVVWRMVQNRATNLPQRFRDMLTDYNKVLHGKEIVPARWRSCIGYVDDTFGLAVGRLFVEKNFDEESKSDMMLMISNLRTAFRELLHGLDWVDAETSELVFKKVEAIQLKIGYSDDILVDSYLNTHYENITVNRSQYFENILANLREGAISALKLLRHKLDKKLWTTSPVSVNAFYSFTYNRIMFPAGILQPPFYHKSQPKFVNYGAIGAVIGHKILHGFEDRDHHYDKGHNLEKLGSNDTFSRFSQKAQCLINQYNQYLVPEAEKYVNGINTQSENVADNGGLKLSYKAYRRWVESQGKEELTLPGLNLTQSQLFFVAFAQVWCSNMRPEDAINRVLTGEHSPGQFRVIGPLQNSKDFSDAFNCPVGSYMHPPDEERCYVW